MEKIITNTKNAADELDELNDKIAALRQNLDATNHGAPILTQLNKQAADATQKLAELKVATEALKNVGEVLQAGYATASFEANSIQFPVKKGDGGQPINPQTMADETMAKLKEQAAREAEVQMTIDQNKLDVAAEEAEKRKAIAMGEFEFKKKLGQDTLQLADTLSNLLLQEGQKQNAIQKSLALIKIGIDSASAISSAISTANAPTPDNVASGGLAGIAKYVALSTQILTAAVKAKSLLGSGGGGATNVSAPVFSPPKIQAPLLAGTPINARQHSPEPLKVYVTEADIRKTHHKVQVIEGQATVV